MATPERWEPIEPSDRIVTIQGVRYCISSMMSLCCYGEEVTFGGKGTWEKRVNPVIPLDALHVAHLLNSGDFIAGVEFLGR